MNLDSQLRETLFQFSWNLEMLSSIVTLLIGGNHQIKRKCYLISVGMLATLAK